MANVSGLLGTAGGYKGTGIDAPLDTVSQAQLEHADQGVYAAMQGQNDLLTALQAQNGLGNQSNVYNQYQNIANGVGPNPAQTQLAQATAANTANQAAMQAGQRGSSTNTGLIARQAAMQGGQNQQQAAGQAATLQAQQSLGALQQMGGIANTQVANQVGQTNANTSARQAQQSALLTSTANENANRQALISGTAQQQAAIGGGAMNGVGSAVSSVGAEGGDVSDMPQMEMSAPASSPSEFASTPDSNDQGKASQASSSGSAKSSMSTFGKMFSMFGLAEGGSVPMGDSSSYQGQSKFGQYLTGVDRVTPGPDETWGFDILRNSGKASGGSKPAGDIPPMEQSDMMAKGGKTHGHGKIPVLLSPGEKKLTPAQAKQVAKGKLDPMKAGETVPGKPKVAGAKNDYANDTVPSKEEPGTIILPRSVTQSKHPHWAAMKFVHAHMMANGGVIPNKPKKGK